MSKQLVKNYTLNVPGKTITLTEYGTLYLERLQLIVDVKTNTIIYNFADPTLATATVTGNVITLSTMGGTTAGDSLMIIYDSAVNDPIYDWSGVVNLTGSTKDTDSVLSYPRGYNYKELTGNGVITNSPGKLHGLLVNSGSPTITIYDNASAASGSTVNTGLTPTAGTYLNLGDARLLNGAYAAITGTCDVTFYYDPTTT